MVKLCWLDAVKICRSQNNAAHQLAYFAIRSRRRNEVFFNCFFKFVMSIACKNTI